MRFVCISDTHTLERKIGNIPDGEVIIHAGDFMSSGWSKYEYINFLSWYGALPHKHKILVAGNHDRQVQIEPEYFKHHVDREKIIYLEDSSTIIDNIVIHGSPWQKWFHDWAFNFPSDEKNYKRKAELVWGAIPDNTNVLITHGQPYGINDKTEEGDLTGCKFLKKRISKLKSLKYYIGGHIHEAYGVQSIKGVTYINPAICTRRYNPTNSPIVFDYDNGVLISS